MSTDQDTTGVEPMTDPLNFIEASDYGLMVHLGLRHHYWSDSAEKGTHADQRPCPSWCWVGQDPEYDHPIEPNNPMTAQHNTNGSIHVAASLYPGKASGAGEQRIITASTIEPRIEQVGQQDPTIRVGLRHFAGGESLYEHDHLKLTIEDAREFITALSYLVDLAEKG